MSVQHHGEGERSDLMRRFQEQQSGEYMRKFPDGRTGADDDGELTYAMATDSKHGTIVVRFAHPTEWIALDVKAATELRDQLTDRLLELRGISV